MPRNKARLAEGPSAGLALEQQVAARHVRSRVRSHMERFEDRTGPALRSLSTTQVTKLDGQLFRVNRMIVRARTLRGTIGSLVGDFDDLMRNRGAIPRDLYDERAQQLARRTGEIAGFAQWVAGPGRAATVRGALVAVSNHMRETAHLDWPREVRWDPSHRITFWDRPDRPDLAGRSRSMSIGSALSLASKYLYEFERAAGRHPMFAEGSSPGGIRDYVHDALDVAAEELSRIGHGRRIDPFVAALWETDRSERSGMDDERARRAFFDPTHHLWRTGLDAPMAEAAAICDAGVRAVVVDINQLLAPDSTPARAVPGAEEFLVQLGVMDTPTFVVTPLSDGELRAALAQAGIPSARNFHSLHRVNEDVIDDYKASPFTNKGERFPVAVIGDATFLEDALRVQRVNDPVVGVAVGTNPVRLDPRVVRSHVHELSELLFDGGMLDAEIETSHRIPATRLYNLNPHGFSPELTNAAAAGLGL